MLLDQNEPRKVLLNFEGFRSKFHIYEIRREADERFEQPAYTIRKQLLKRPTSFSRMQGIIESQAFSELQVSRDHLTKLFDLIRATHIPLNRAGRAGVDGSWYSLTIGSDVRATIIEWWSDCEPELAPVYKLRDAIVKTVNGLLKNAAKSQERVDE